MPEALPMRPDTRRVATYDAGRAYRFGKRGATSGVPEGERKKHFGQQPRRGDAVPICRHPYAKRGVLGGRLRVPTRFPEFLTPAPRFRSIARNYIARRLAVAAHTTQPPTHLPKCADS